MTPVLYSANTPNGLKPILMLEELGIPYELVRVDLQKQQQKTPEFHALNANERIPVLETEIDGRRIAIAESAAILVHLAETHGDRFLPRSGALRARALQWSFFQMGSVGPMFGQLGYWKRRQVENAEAVERYAVETRRIYSVLDEQLSRGPYLAGEDYTIADMLTLFWARSPWYFGLSLDAWPNVERWVRELETRPAVQRTLAISWR